MPSFHSTDRWSKPSQQQRMCECDRNACGAPSAADPRYPFLAGVSPVTLHQRKQNSGTDHQTTREDRRPCQNNVRVYLPMVFPTSSAPGDPCGSRTSTDAPERERNLSPPIPFPTERHHNHNHNGNTNRPVHTHRGACSSGIHHKNSPQGMKGYRGGHALFPLKSRAEIVANAVLKDAEDEEEEEEEKAADQRMRLHLANRKASKAGAVWETTQGSEGPNRLLLDLEDALVDTTNLLDWWNSKHQHRENDVHSTGRDPENDDENIVSGERVARRHGLPAVLVQGLYVGVTITVPSHESQPPQQPPSCVHPSLPPRRNHHSSDHEFPCHPHPSCFQGYFTVLGARDDVGCGGGDGGLTEEGVLRGGGGDRGREAEDSVRDAAATSVSPGSGVLRSTYVSNRNEEGGGDDDQDDKDEGGAAGAAVSKPTTFSATDILGKQPITIGTTDNEEDASDDNKKALPMTCMLTLSSFLQAQQLPPEVEEKLLEHLREYVDAFLVERTVRKKMMRQDRHPFPILTQRKAALTRNGNEEEHEREEADEGGARDGNDAMGAAVQPPRLWLRVPPPFWLAAYAHTPRIHARLLTYATDRVRQRQQAESTKSASLPRRRRSEGTRKIPGTAHLDDEALVIPWPDWVPPLSVSLNILYAMHYTAFTLLDKLSIALEETNAGRRAEMDPESSCLTFSDAVFGSRSTATLMQTFFHHLGMRLDAANPQAQQQAVLDAAYGYSSLARHAMDKAYTHGARHKKKSDTDRAIGVLRHCVYRRDGAPLLTPASGALHQAVDASEGDSAVDFPALLEMFHFTALFWATQAPFTETVGAALDRHLPAWPLVLPFAPTRQEEMSRAAQHQRDCLRVAAFVERMSVWRLWRSLTDPSASSFPPRHGATVERVCRDGFGAGEEAAGNWPDAWAHQLGHAPRKRSPCASLSQQAALHSPAMAAARWHSPSFDAVDNRVVDARMLQENTHTTPKGASISARSSHPRALTNFSQAALALSQRLSAITAFTATRCLQWFLLLDGDAPREEARGNMKPDGTANEHETESRSTRHPLSGATEATPQLQRCCADADTLAFALQILPTLFQQYLLPHEVHSTLRRAMNHLQESHVTTARQNQESAQPVKSQRCLNDDADTLSRSPEAERKHQCAFRFFLVVVLWAAFHPRPPPTSSSYALQTFCGAAEAGEEEQKEKSNERAPVTQQQQRPRRRCIEEEAETALVWHEWLLPFFALRGQLSWCHVPQAKMPLPHCEEAEDKKDKETHASVFLSSAHAAVAWAASHYFYHVKDVLGVLQRQIKSDGIALATKKGPNSERTRESHWPSERTSHHGGRARTESNPWRRLAPNPVDASNAAVVTTLRSDANHRGFPSFSHDHRADDAYSARSGSQSSGACRPPTTRLATRSPSRCSLVSSLAELVRGNGKETTQRQRQTERESRPSSWTRAPSSCLLMAHSIVSLEEDDEACDRESETTSARTAADTQSDTGLCREVTPTGNQQKHARADARPSQHRLRAEEAAQAELLACHSHTFPWLCGVSGRVRKTHVTQLRRTLEALVRQAPAALLTDASSRLAGLLTDTNTSRKHQHDAIKVTEALQDGSHRAPSVASAQAYRYLYGVLPPWAFPMPDFTEDASLLSLSASASSSSSSSTMRPLGTADLENGDTGVIISPETRASEEEVQTQADTPCASTERCHQTEIHRGRRRRESHTPHGRSSNRSCRSHKKRPVREEEKEREGGRGESEASDDKASSPSAETNSITRLRTRRSTTRPPSSSRPRHEPATPPPASQTARHLSEGPTTVATSAHASLAAISASDETQSHLVTHAAHSNGSEEGELFVERNLFATPSSAPDSPASVVVSSLST